MWASTKTMCFMQIFSTHQEVAQRYTDMPNTSSNHHSINEFGCDCLYTVDRDASYSHHTLIVFMHHRVEHAVYQPITFFPPFVRTGSQQQHLMCLMRRTLRCHLFLNQTLRCLLLMALKDKSKFLAKCWNLQSLKTWLSSLKVKWRGCWKAWSPNFLRFLCHVHPNLQLQAQKGLGPWLRRLQSNLCQSQRVRRLEKTPSKVTWGHCLLHAAATPPQT